MRTIKARSETIVCRLTSADLKDVGGTWQRLFRTLLVSRDPVPGGLRLSFSAGSEEALGLLVEIEMDCCQWISFQLDGPILTMTAKGEGEQSIRTMWAVDADAG